MYVLLENNIVKELIPNENPAFPGVSVVDRYPASFVARLILVENDSAAQLNWIYDPATKTFSAPPEPEPGEDDPEPEPEPGKPSISERVNALEEAMLALMEGY